MKKYISLILVGLCTLGLLTGCVESDIGVKLNANETGSITATLGIEEEAYEQFVSMGATMFDGKETTTYEHDGKTYVACTEVTEYKSFNEIEQALLEMTYDTDEFADMEASDDEVDTDEPIETDEADVSDTETEETDETDAEEAEPAHDNRVFKSVKIEKEGGLFYTVYTFKAVLNPQPKSDDADMGISLPMDDMFHMTFSIEMPTKITQSSGGTVEDNKVTFEIDDITEEAEFSAVSEQSNIVVILIIVLTLVVLLITFAVCLKRKNNA